MSSKFSILPVIADQYATFTDAATGKPRIADYFAVLGVPAALATWSATAGWKISIVGELISAVSIITALLFGLVVFLFELRVHLGSKEVAARIPMASVQLIDEMFKNVAYSIVIGFVALTAAVAGAAFRAEGTDPLGVPLSAFVVFVGAHFVLTLAMCLKRLTKAYDKVARL